MQIHQQCSEGFMHTRMRRRVESLIQVKSSSFAVNSAFSFSLYSLPWQRGIFWEVVWRNLDLTRQMVFSQPNKFRAVFLSFAVHLILSNHVATCLQAVQCQHSRMLSLGLSKPWERVDWDLGIELDRGWLLLRASSWTQKKKL